MKKERLKSLLNDKILELQKLPYEELCKFIDNPRCEEHGEGDNFYQIEIESFWDDGKRRTKNLRVMVTIDDGGITAFSPLAESFIVTPDGKLL
ncbi:MAG: hypothetical protein Q8O04_12560 [Deltaproteobacteria bacterium]|nr:hypothetical protein [Deltaproteobacteria bacterium]